MENTAARLGIGTSELADYAQKIGLLAKIVSGFNSVMKGLNDFMNLFNDKEDKKTAVKLTTETLNNYIKTMEANSDNIFKGDLARATVQTKAVALNNPGADDDGLVEFCNTASARAAQIVLQTYAQSISQTALDGIMNSGRGFLSNNNGPQYGALNMGTRCPQSSDPNHANDPPTWNPLDNGPTGPPPECKNWVDPTGALTDADLKAPSVNTVLETPTFQKVTQGNMTTYVPVVDASSQQNDPERYAAQQAWIAAWHYCYEVTGPAPTKPSSDNPLADDRIKMAQFDHCTALRSAFIKQCTDRLAKFSRPNCSDPNLSEICKIGMMACDAASPEMSLPFGCNKGINLYQAEYVSNMPCVGEQRLMAIAKTGQGLTAVQTRHLDMCRATQAAWKAQLAKEEKNFVDGLRGIRKLKECWAGVGATVNPTIQQSGSSPSASNSLDQPKSVSAPAMTPAKTQQTVKDYMRTKNALPVGVPFDASELQMPASVAQ
jgi:hypothetical protein